MNQVQKLKNQFEKLNSNIESLDLTHPIVRAKSEPPTNFTRAATCIDFSKIRLKEVPKDAVREETTKPQFQRQLSNSSNSSYKSIRRSPAFRFDGQTRPSIVKNVTKEDPVKKKTEIDELQYLSTSATIKKALLKPLPTGSPPKKPPRTFLSPQFPKKQRSREASPELLQTQIQRLRISPKTLPKKVTKTGDKKAISSFLNCIISPCAIDPIYYEQIKNERHQNRDADETIYMEPYAHLKKDFANNIQSSPTENEELHYMCTVLDPQPADVNGNLPKDDQKDLKRSSLETSDIEDYDKVNVKSMRKMFCLE